MSGRTMKDPFSQIYVKYKSAVVRLSQTACTGYLFSGVTKWFWSATNDQNSSCFLQQ